LRTFACIVPAMAKWRVLVIAESANPEWVSVPLVGWSLAEALRRVSHVHIVTHTRNREAFIKFGLEEGRDFTAINSDLVAGPLFKLAERVRGGAGKGWTTVQAVTLPAYLYFEELVWRRFGPAICRGEYDIVHRVTPLSPTTPSPIARRVDRAGVPFVIGPLNGGVPWPPGFDSERRAEKEWLSYVRDAYRLIPGYRSTRARSAALIIASLDTLAQLPKKYHDRVVYIPENGVDLARFPEFERRPPEIPIRISWVGRFVPYKGADMLLDAAAELIRAGQVVIDLIGDGPQRPEIEAQIARLGLADGVHLRGWVKHEEMAKHLAESDVLGFPAVREFGGGVVLEAFACGTPAVVVDYAGPRELVTPATGIAVPLGTREEIVAGFRRALQELVDDPQRLAAMSRATRDRVLRYYTWDKKAEQVAAIYDWVMGSAPKPDFGTPFPP